jgi:hypothetical protein
MNWLQFIAAVVGHLAWPTVILIVVFGVRKHLGSLAERILELSFGGAKVTFDKALQKGAEIIDVSPTSAQPMPPPETEPELPPPVGNDELTSATGSHPDIKLSNALWLSTGIGRIISAYETIDELLREIGDMIGLKTKNGAQIIESLYRRGLIAEEMRQLYRGLRDARNAVAHARALPNEEEIVEYTRQASYLNAFLHGTYQHIKSQK